MKDENKLFFDFSFLKIISKMFDLTLLKTKINYSELIITI